MYAIDDDIKQLEARIEHIERFLRARSMLHSDSGTAFSICHQLLRDLDSEDEVDTLLCTSHSLKSLW